MTRKETHDELISHLQEQFEINRKALHDLREVTRKLEVMNHKLQESEELKSHFLSNIRNEITNPLAAIMGLSNRLLAGETLKRLPTVARMIHEEAFALDFQLQNIFAAAELEAGEAEPEWALADIRALVANILELLAHRLIGKQMEVKLKLPDSLPFVTDARKLHLIAINLLVNAVEFSPPNQSVEVEGLVTEGELSLRVRDFGTGIPLAERESVFDRFRQLDSGPTKGHRGHGLGLSVSRAMAEMLGGHLKLEDVAGPGASFRLTLMQPAEATETVAPEANLFLFGGGERF